MFVHSKTSRFLFKLFRNFIWLIMFFSQKHNMNHQFVKATFYPLYWGTRSYDSLTINHISHWPNFLAKILSTWQITCHVVNCLLCFGVGMSTLCLKKINFKNNFIARKYLWTTTTMLVMQHYLGPICHIKKWICIKGGTHIHFKVHMWLQQRYVMSPTLIVFLNTNCRPQYKVTNTKC